MVPRKYAARAKPFAPMLDKVYPGLATDPVRLVQVHGAVQLGAGLMLATGTAPRPAAAVLAGTLVPATLVNHPFWRVPNDTLRRHEQVQFAKNLGLLAGLMLAAADTAGAPSFRWRAQRALRKAQ